ncbi:hypothetical protein RchiOBHm_Chr5g0019661 [Rosa chinensis]|uniref:Uncharacterized protein n=1 Tax=Rosa chinensis TaxID=74649 RepID=A0A2P6Q736_ROSCH|nr:hypothetical protein RchiOBHm_Chr5g0019661 [Rosa chinensis]
MAPSELVSGVARSPWTEKVAAMRFIDSFFYGFRIWILGGWDALVLQSKDGFPVRRRLESQSCWHNRRAVGAGDAEATAASRARRWRLTQMGLVSRSDLAKVLGLLEDKSETFGSVG